MLNKKHLPITAAIFVFIAHLFGNPHYGFFRDELYFIICGFSPAFGYVDQPPLAPLLAAGSQMFGHSLLLLRAVPAFFAASSIYVTCLLVAEFGGGFFAQILAVIVAFFCPVLMNFGMKISPDMVGLTLWPLTALFILRVLKGGSNYFWILAGIALGVSFQAKYSVVFFAVALLVGLLLTAQRKKIFSVWCIAGVSVAALIALPNILWQWKYGFPMLELLQNGQKGKNLILTPSGFMIAQLIITNPILSLVWIAGLIWLFKKNLTRFLAIAFVILMIEMIVMHGKHYYSANIYPIMFAAGSVAIESWTMKRHSVRPLILGLATLCGLIFVPYMMPVLPVESFVKYNQIAQSLVHMEAARTENHGEGPLPQDWADMHGWPELAETVANVYQSLSKEEKSKAIIAASNYGQASAIEFFGINYGLPTVVSGHNQYFLWGLRGNSGEVLIDVGGDCGKDIRLYQSSTVAATFRHPYVMPYEDGTKIMVCKGLNRPLDEIWPGVKKYR